MSQIIVKPVNGTAKIIEDDTRIIRLDEEVPPTGRVLIPFDLWKAERDYFLPRAKAGELGVWLSPDCDSDSLAEDAKHLSVIGFDFPEFKFGQAYSGAVLLRTRYGFQGEIRAFGDIWRDQLFYLARCGFTQFSLKAGKSLEDGLDAFADFTTPYQTSADQALPIFTRRAA